jgi:mRNA-degrading endonuclease RelE of RelBE toxin-antitoxin system
MDIIFAPSFIRQFDKLEPSRQAEIEEKIALFRDKGNHEQLKVHKLKGRMIGKHSFSVNHKTRIVFSFISRESAVLFAIGNHDIYK